MTNVLVVLTSVTLNDREPSEIESFNGFFLRFSAAVQISRVNYDEMAGDRPRQSANGNC